MVVSPASMGSGSSASKTDAEGENGWGFLCQTKPRICCVANDGEEVEPVDLDDANPAAAHRKALEAAGHFFPQPALDRTEKRAWSRPAKAESAFGDPIPWAVTMRGPSDFHGPDPRFAASSWHGRIDHQAFPQPITQPWGLEPSPLPVALEPLWLQPAGWEDPRLPQELLPTQTHLANPQIDPPFIWQTHPPQQRPEAQPPPPDVPGTQPWDSELVPPTGAPAQHGQSHSLAPRVQEFSVKMPGAHERALSGRPLQATTPPAPQDQLPFDTSLSAAVQRLASQRGLDWRDPPVAPMLGRPPPRDVPAQSRLVAAAQAYAQQQANGTVSPKCGAAAAQSSVPSPPRTPPRKQTPPGRWSQGPVRSTPGQLSYGQMLPIIMYDD